MVLATFWSLIVAAACLWLPHTAFPRVARWAWAVVALVGVGFAVESGLVDGIGVAILALLTAAARGAHRGGHWIVRAMSHVAVVGISTGLFLHVLPGFHNPLVVGPVILSPGGESYSQYLNVDKGLTGLVLLGVYVPQRVERDRGWRHAAGFSWRFVVLVAVVITLALAIGYVRWDPKVPSWWAEWMGIMIVLTALPEEAAFRGVVQSWLSERLGDSADAVAIVIGGLAFGVAHGAGGPMYVVVASAAGIGYGWIFAATGSMGAAILAHAGLNTIHLLFFTYPSLARL
jgi:membrane protease YdiL (CAAX protease family)